MFYSSSHRIKGSKTYKYKNYIQKPKSLKTKKGEGFKDFVKTKPHFVYWNDVNQLIDRLKLLISSLNSGHTGHNNEITSIIQELKEENLIE